MTRRGQGGVKKPAGGAAPRVTPTRQTVKAPSYFSTPKSAFIGYDDDGTASMTADTVFESDPVILDTGLLDRHGDPILRQEKKRPIGFCRGDDDA